MTKPFSFATILAVFSFGTSSVASADDVKAENCPAPYTIIFPYPAEFVQKGIEGEFVLKLKLDACGRVIEIETQRKHKNTDLYKYVESILKTFVFSEYQRRNAVDNWINYSVAFTLDSPGKAPGVDWPKSHKHPKYMLDEQTTGFATVQLAYDEIKDVNPKRQRPAVVDFIHVFRQVATQNGLEFWLFISQRQGPPVIAARYRTILEADAPIVKVAFQCETIALAACDAVKAKLLLGLPFAMPK